MELQKLGVTVESQVKEYNQLKPGAYIPITMKDKPERIRWRTNHGTILKDKGVTYKLKRII
jgi:hypothetical protein